MGNIGDRLSQAGGVFLGSGITIGAGWGVFAAQTAPDRLWDWPMWVATAMILLGAAMLLWSFFGSDQSGRGERRLVQKQSGGAGSVNLQAGRDITYKNKD